jgi:hypothetical protein
MIPPESEQKIVSVLRIVIYQMESIYRDVLAERGNLQGILQAPSTPISLARPQLLLTHVQLFSQAMHMALESSAGDSVPFGSSSHLLYRRYVSCARPDLWILSTH